MKCGDGAGRGQRVWARMIDLGTSTEIFGCLDRARARAARGISYLVDLYGRRPLDAEYLALLVAEDERGAVAQHLVALQALHDDAVGSHLSRFALGATAVS